MLLIQDTIDKYGYDPNTLSPGSHKLVLFQCPECGEVREVRVRYFTGDDYVCRPCPGKDYKNLRNVKPRWKLDTPRDPATLHPQVRRQATFERFDYFPEEISAQSSQEVVWECAECHGLQASRERVLKNERVLCFKCNNLDKTINRNRAAVASGHAPNGLPLGIDFDVKRKNERIWQGAWRTTPTGNLINRLRVSLANLHRGISTRHLEYLPDEYVAHVSARLKHWRGVCPLCRSKEIAYDTCDVDHRVPVSSVRDTDSVIILFDLVNLDVLCPGCNQHFKRDRFVDYWSRPGIVIEYRNLGELLSAQDDQAMKSFAVRLRTSVESHESGKAVLTPRKARVNRTKILTKQTHEVTAWKETKSLNAWSKDPRCVVSYPTIHTRIVKQGIRPELAFTSPIGTRFTEEDKVNE